jgi:hypothetical protein
MNGASSNVGIKPTHIATGAWCEIQHHGEDETEMWRLSFGDWKDDALYDSFGIPDSEIAYYTTWAELPSLFDPLNGEDFHIVAITQVMWAKVTQ